MRYLNTNEDVLRLSSLKEELAKREHFFIYCQVLLTMVKQTLKILKMFLKRPKRTHFCAKSA